MINQAATLPHLEKCMTDMTNKGLTEALRLVILDCYDLAVFGTCYDTNTSYPMRQLRDACKKLTACSVEDSSQ